MKKLFSIILFCVFPLLALSHEAEQVVPKAADDNAATEAPQANEEVELSEEQKQYNFCVMQIALETIRLTHSCTQRAFTGFAVEAVEHGQEALPEYSIEDIGAQCFHSGTQVIQGALEDCKEVALKIIAAAEAETEAAEADEAAAVEAEAVEAENNDDLPVKAKE